MVGKNSGLNLQKHVTTTDEGFDYSQELFFVGRVVQLSTGKTTRLNSHWMFELSGGIELGDDKTPTEEQGISLENCRIGRIVMGESRGRYKMSLEGVEGFVLVRAPNKRLVFLGE